MRISELSERSGSSIATIKFYLRDGLLPPGTWTAVNRADYDESHVHRLRLIRSLREVGRLDLGRIRLITEAIDETALPANAVFRVVQEALRRTDDRPTGDGVPEALADVDRFLAGLGWDIAPTASARRELADCLLALRLLGRAGSPEVFRRYAEAIEPLAAWEVGVIPPGADTSDAVERMAVGTVVFETALGALRRLAHEHHSARRSSTAADAGT